MKLINFLLFNHNGLLNCLKIRKKIIENGVHVSHPQKMFPEAVFTHGTSLRLGFLGVN